MEEPDCWEQYERPLAREEAMQAEPMQGEPGRSPVCSMFCMSPHWDFNHASRGVGRVFRVIRVPFFCFRSCLWERLQCHTRCWRPLYVAPRRQGPEHHAAGAQKVASSCGD